MHFSQSRAQRETLLAQRVARLRIRPPRELDEHLEAAGYRGQLATRRAVCVLAYRHMRRLQRLHLEGASPEELPRRDAYLLLGPTGCGKTHLIELLFREILEVPTVTVDITQFSETGYVGHDVSTILTRLVDAAGGDPDWAGCGVVCIDEIDKIAGGSTSARFAGQGTTKDVSGWGVQRSLLALLDAPRAEYQPDHGFSGHTEPKTLALSGVTFIACGAFSGLRRDSMQTRPLGFGGAQPSTEAAVQEIEPADLERYGFMPELLGRFSRLLELTPLGRSELHAILDDLIGRYRDELKDEGLSFGLEERVANAVVDAALRRGLGARGLRSEVTRMVEELLYEHAGSAEKAQRAALEAAGEVSVHVP